MNLVPDPATLLLSFRTDSAPPLPVGVVVDGGGPAPWAGALLAFLKQVPGIDVRLLTLATRSPETRPPWLADRLYTASRARLDPFGAPPAVSTDAVSAECIEEIRRASCAVLIWLAHTRDAGLDLKPLAPAGALTVHFGRRDRSIPFWDECASGDPISPVSLYWHESSLGMGRLVRTAEIPTWLGLYPTLNGEEAAAAAIRSLAGICLDIRADRRENLGASPEVALDRAAGYPSNLGTAAFIARKLARSARLRRAARGKVSRWFVAMRRNRGASLTDPDALDLSGFRDVPLPEGTEAMADPFLHETGGRQYLLFEELAAGCSRGRLGCVEVRDDGSCSGMTVVLERDYHLSYPCVVPHGDELFLLPESSEARRVDLYRFTRFPDRLELAATPLEGAALVDTTPVFVDGIWYFFTTTVQPFLETFLFWSERLDGRWNLHPVSPVSGSVRNSRSAGHLFWRNGRLYRPTQDCSVCYGYAIQVNEVVRLTPDEFEERPAACVLPSWRPGLMATHTWNESSRLQVIDGIRRQPAR